MYVKLLYIMFSRGSTRIFNGILICLGDVKVASPTIYFRIQNHSPAFGKMNFKHWNVWGTEIIMRSEKLYTIAKQTIRVVYIYSHRRIVYTLSFVNCTYLNKRCLRDVEISRTLHISIHRCKFIHVFFNTESAYII